MYTSVTTREREREGETGGGIKEEDIERETCTSWNRRVDKLTALVDGGVKGRQASQISRLYSQKGNTHKFHKYGYNNNQKEIGK